MDKYLALIIGAILTTVTAMLVRGVVITGKEIAETLKLTKSLVVSVQAIYNVQPKVIMALRHHSAALKEAGANGSTEKANECLDAADAELDRRLEQRVGGAA